MSELKGLNKTQLNKPTGLNEAAEEYCYKAKIFNPKEESLETLAFKAGAKFERERIRQAWPSDELSKWAKETMTGGECLDEVMISDWLRERVLGDEQ